MEEFIAYLVKNLVDDVTAVRVQLSENKQDLLLEIHVAPTDVARVVGRRGRTIQALRVLATAIGARFGRRVKVELAKEQDVEQGIPTEAASVEIEEEIVVVGE